MTSDDRRVLEKQTTVLPPSIGFFRVQYREYNAVMGLGAIFALAIGVYLAFYLRPKGHLLPNRRPNGERLSASPKSFLNVPFVALHNSLRYNAGPNRKSVDQILRSVMENYQQESSQALAGLSMMLYEALSSEANRHDLTKNSWKSEKLLSAKIQRRIELTASCLEHDEKVLAALLGNFSYVLALPERQTKNAAAETTTESARVREETTSTEFHLKESKKKGLANKAETHSYDSATQIWAHIVRDWTVEGKAIRHTLYDWCCQQMETFCPYRATVLVPGSGMGRLAYDLYQRGYNVEANELSPSMAAAACSVLRNQISGSFHPYVLDGMANEVDSARRFGSVHFPDVHIETITTIDGTNSLENESSRRSSLSYTVGDFVGNDDDYYSRERVGHFDAIVS